MTSRAWLLPACGATMLILGSLVSPLRHGLQSSMTAQMLVQVPLLVAAGCLFAPAFPARLLSRIHGWNQGGVTGLVVATIAAAFWMLPRSLDASTTDPVMTGAKYLSVPLLVGLPFALSWPRMGFVVRGVFLAELVATLFRLGWLYRSSPIRLCNNFGLNDQRRLGGYLLVLGAGLLLYLTWKLLWGRFASFSGAPLAPGGDVPPMPPRPAPHDDGSWTPDGLLLDRARAYEDARLQGLCHEGAMEVAAGVSAAARRAAKARDKVEQKGCGKGKGQEVLEGSPQAVSGRGRTPSTSPR